MAKGASKGNAAVAPLPADFVGPPTEAQAKAAAKQAYDAAPGVKRSTANDTDGARTKTQEEYSVVMKIAVAQHTLDEEARKAEAKKKKEKFEPRNLNNKDFNKAQEKYDALTPAEKTAKYQEWQQGLLGDLDSAKAGDAYSDGNGGTGHLSAAQAKSLQGASAELRENGFLTQPPGNSDALADLMAKHKTEYNSFQIPFWNIKGAHGGVWDPFWQNDSSAGQVGYTEPDGIKGPNPLTTPYIVSDGGKFKAGDFALVSAPNGNSTFLRVMDHNPGKGIQGNSDSRQAEMSPATYTALKYQDGAPLTPSVGEVKVQAYPGSGTGSGPLGYLTPAETQEAGALIKSGKVSSIRNAEELKEAKADPAAYEARKKAEAAAAAEEKEKGKGKGKSKGGNKKKTADSGQGSGIPILVAANTVFAGQLKRQVGKASPQALHEGGGYLAQGSNTVSVENCPLPRIGDRTSDNMFVVRGQGDVQSA